MPRSKRPQRERTHDWQRIQQYTLWPEQKVYEMLRPKSRPRNDPTRNVKTVAPSHFVVLCRRTYHIQFFAERNVCNEGTTCQIRYGSDKLDGP